MTDQQLFDELVKRGVVDTNVAAKILKSAAASGKSAEEILYEERAAPEEAVAQVKSKLLSVPYKVMDPEKVPDDVISLIPYDTSRTYRVVPFEKRDNMLVVGMLNPEDVQAQNALTFIAKQNQLGLGVYLTTPSVLHAVWRRYMPYKDEIQAAIKEFGAVKEEQEITALEEGLQSSQDAPVIKIVASTLRQAVDIGASDIHIEPQRRRLRIRFRVDGKLHEVATLPVGLSHTIVSRVKVLARLRLDETRVPQDGRFRTIMFGRDIDFRVSTFPTPSGEKVAIRVLDSTTGVKSMDELGLRPYGFAPLQEGVEAPYGMILMTGPTGSGKTTTLYAIMNKLSSDEVNIISLEDPVEYFIEGVNQSQVMPEIGYSFASGLRQILRQDPDIIMVGEIRDKETAGLAVNAALTGHLILSTLHTNNAVGVIPRLIDLGVPSFLLPSALNIMVAQRLVAHLCPKCRTKEKPPQQIQNTIKQELQKLPDAVRSDVAKRFSPPYEVYKPQPKNDCDVCKGKGTIGRTAIFEVLRMTKELGNLITTGFTESALWEEATRQGMVTLRQDGIIKALEGDVLLEEILRETEE
ncbi:MAG TPA: type II/IV secretion system protein [Candidatus Jorgensenbacteria bacterium]|nr:type II/IV secretion system protein [Candidatus Jorgensenbacteria bacterium]